jgi:hypothetical protein
MKPSIQTEQDAVKICLAIHRYSGVSWSAVNLGQFLTIPLQRIRFAVEWLESKKYIWTPRNVYSLTEFGIEYVEGLAQRTDIGKPGDTFKFKDEALTGMNAKGGRSSIDRAVLPTGKTPHTTRTPEDTMIEKDRTLKSKEALADRLGITVEKLQQFIFEGRLAHCKKCDSVGIFDVSFYNGAQRRQSYCRKCRKKVKK